MGGLDADVNEQSDDNVQDPDADIDAFIHQSLSNTDANSLSSNGNSHMFTLYMDANFLEPDVNGCTTTISSFFWF